MKFLGWIVCLFSMAALSAFAESGETDIRYRSVVYLFPQQAAPDMESIPALFNGYEPVKALPKIAMKPTIRFALETDVAKNYPVPDPSYLSYFGRGLTKNQVERIQAATAGVVIDVAYPVDHSLKALKFVSQKVHEFAQLNGGLIWDSETRELFTPDVWKAKRIDSWNGEYPSVEDHTVIHSYREGEGVRAITLGMAKFGVPDVVVNNFSWSVNRSMGELVNLVSQSLVEGIRPKSNGALSLNIEMLNDTRFKQQLTASLYENAMKQFDLVTSEAQWFEGDPYNLLLEIRFDDRPGHNLSEKQENLLSELFGWEDNITYIKHNREIEEASARARQKLENLKQDFNAGLEPGEYILLKAPFTTDDGGNEWMWVEVLAWKSGTINGLLKNEPYHIKGLKAGAEVEISQSDVFDYIRQFADDRSEGNETGELIMKYQSAEKN